MIYLNGRFINQDVVGTICETNCVFNYTNVYEFARYLGTFG